MQDAASAWILSARNVKINTSVSTRNQKTKQLTPAPKSGITHNIELVNKQPRELITDMRNILYELISRGYEYKNGKLYYTQEIKLI